MLVMNLTLAHAWRSRRFGCDIRAVGELVGLLTWPEGVPLWYQCEKEAEAEESDGNGESNRQAVHVGPEDALKLAGGEMVPQLRGTEVEKPGRIVGRGVNGGPLDQGGGEGGLGAGTREGAFVVLVV